MKLKGLKFDVVGVTFMNPNGRARQQIIGEMTKNSPVTLTREPANPYDKNAVAVSTMGEQIGYIGKQFAAHLAPMMDSGRQFEARIEEVGRYKDTNYCHIIVDEV